MKTEMQEMLLLGFREVDITPDGPIEMIGFGRSDETSRGIGSRLVAQVSVWTLGESRCCLAAIDHIGYSKEHARLIRDRVGACLAIRPEAVMLCFSHTHSAPNDSVEEAYFEVCAEAIVSAACEAAADLTPVRIGWGNAEGNIGMNRRGKDADLDRRIGVLKVTEEKSGALRLILLRVTAHANVLKEDNYCVSADFFGRTRDLLSAEYGCPVMLTQGASGNVAPLYYCTKRHFTEEDPALDYYGKVASPRALDEMAEEILRCTARVLANIVTERPLALRAYSVLLTLGADVPTKARASMIREEAKAAGIDGMAWSDEVGRLLRAGITTQYESVELQYFQIGRGTLCGCPNEIMCEFALRAVEKSGDEFFYLGGYTNGCTGYFPTEKEYDRGGYEVFWSMLIYFVYYDRVSPFQRESATLLIEAAVKGRKECPES